MLLFDAIINTFTTIRWQYQCDTYTIYEWFRLPRASRISPHSHWFRDTPCEQIRPEHFRYIRYADIVIASLIRYVTGTTLCRYYHSRVTSATSKPQNFKPSTKMVYVLALRVTFGAGTGATWYALRCLQYTNTLWSHMTRQEGHFGHHEAMGQILAKILISISCLR